MSTRLRKIVHPPSPHPDPLLLDSLFDLSVSGVSRVNVVLRVSLSLNKHLFGLFPSVGSVLPESLINSIRSRLVRPRKEDETFVKGPWTDPSCREEGPFNVFQSVSRSSGRSVVFHRFDSRLTNEPQKVWDSTKISSTM